MNYIEHLFINFSYQNNAEGFSIFYSALAREINDIKNNYQFKIKTIYIATNDFLAISDQELVLLLTLIKPFVSKKLVEYSFEIGYQTIKEKQLLILKKFKINRLVWKVKTFKQELLLNLNQKYKSDDIKQLIKLANEFGYQNFSIDLEDNINNQTKLDILNDLKEAINLKAPHISYQSHTDTHNYENRNIILEFLKQDNYQNYEFFSFALNSSNYSQQTLGYLTLKNWYGLGPNAASFLKLDNKIVTITNSNKIPWSDKMTTLDQFTYYQLLITQNLMLRDGIMLKNELQVAAKSFWPQITKLINKGYLQVEDGKLKATNQGWTLLNSVLIDIITTK